MFSASIAHPLLPGRQPRNHDSDAVPATDRRIGSALMTLHCLARQGNDDPPHPRGARRGRVGSTLAEWRNFPSEAANDATANAIYTTQVPRPD